MRQTRIARLLRILLVVMLLFASSSSLSAQGENIVERGSVVKADDTIIGSFQILRGDWLPLEWMDAKEGDLIRFSGYFDNTPSIHTHKSVYIFPFKEGVSLSRQFFALSDTKTIPVDLPVMKKDGVVNGAAVNKSNDFETVLELFPNIESLHVNYCAEKWGAERVNKFKNLKYLSVRSVSEEFWEKLDTKRLEYIDGVPFPFPSPFKDIVTRKEVFHNPGNPLPEIPKDSCSELNIHLSGNVDECIQTLGKIPAGVLSVHVLAHEVTPADASPIISAIGRLQAKYVRIQFNWNASIQERTIDLAPLSSAQTLHYEPMNARSEYTFLNTQKLDKLTHLSLQGVDIHPDTLLFSNLRTLKLKSTRILKQFDKNFKLKNLEALFVSDWFDCNDEEFERVFSDVKHLYLYGRNIWCNKPMQNVETLCLCADISSANIDIYRSVNTMFPSLKALSLYNNYHSKTLEAPPIQLSDGINFIEVSSVYDDPTLKGGSNSVGEKVIAWTEVISDDTELSHFARLLRAQ